VPGIAFRDVHQTSEGSDFLGMSYGWIDAEDES
jgi:hypothetical protein